MVTSRFKIFDKTGIFQDLWSIIAKLFCHVRGILDLKHRNALSNDRDALKAPFRCSLIHKGSAHQVVLHVRFGVFWGGGGV